MNYFVTGATGFIGRHLVEELLKREGTIYVLVREGSRGKVDDLIAAPRTPPRAGSWPVAGDLSAPGLGVESFDEKIDHLFHLAAVYDIEAEEEASVRANVDGTRHVIEFANSHDVGRFHHTSSIAVAGSYKGVFQEDMFDEDQKLPHHYHRTKYESEKMVREGVNAKTLVFRPGIVVGHSQTGEMDKIDGPYYLFKLLQKLRNALPAWVPLAGPEGGKTTIVPVDFVAKRWTTSHTCPTRAPRRHLPPGGPRPDDHRRRAEHVRPRGPRAPVRDARRPEPDQGGAERSAVGGDGGADGQEDPQSGLRRPQHPSRGDGGARLPLRLRRARHPARTRGHRHRRAPARHLRAPSCGTTGSATSTRTCSRSAPSPTRSGTSALSSPAPLPASGWRPRSGSGRPAEMCSSSRVRARSSRRWPSKSRSRGARHTPTRPTCPTWTTSSG